MCASSAKKRAIRAAPIHPCLAVKLQIMQYGIENGHMTEDDRTAPRKKDPGYQQWYKRWENSKFQFVRSLATDEQISGAWATEPMTADKRTEKANLHKSRIAIKILNERALKKTKIPDLRKRARTADATTVVQR